MVILSLLIKTEWTVRQSKRFQDVLVLYAWLSVQSILKNSDIDTGMVEVKVILESYAKLHVSLKVVVKIPLS